LKFTASPSFAKKASEFRHAEDCFSSYSLYGGGKMLEQRRNAAGLARAAGFLTPEPALLRHERSRKAEHFRIFADSRRQRQAGSSQRD
jgi:hypothetical protein